MYIYNKSSHSRQIGEKSFLLFSPPREINLTIGVRSGILLVLSLGTSADF